jgi:hypothetical protein
MQLKKIVAAGLMSAVMLGSTIGLAETLADYPAPFVATDGTAQFLVVVGSAGADPAGLASDMAGAVDIAARLGGETKQTTTVAGTTVTVTDGDTDEVALGSVLTTTAGLDTSYTDDDMSCLQDTDITLNGTSYSVHDEIQLTNTPNALDGETSLSSTDDDYGSDIFLEIQKDAIKYCFVFDKTVKLDTHVSASTPLEIDFLGKRLKITSIVDADTFTAQVGTKVSLMVDESVEVDDKTVTLLDVSSASTCTVKVDVDGTIDTVSGTETVNGIEINADSCFYRDVKAESSATLIVGKDAVATYDTGDEFTDYCSTGGDSDCDKTNPDWVWEFSTLTTSGSGTTNDICIENDFVKDDDSDDPVGIGEYYWMPRNFAKVGIASLTVPDDSYAKVTVEYDSSTDLSNAPGGGTSEDTITISCDQSDCFNIDYDEFDAQALSADVKTSEIYLHIETTDSLGFYYVDSDNKVQHAGNETMNSSTDSVDFADMNYKDTKGTDIVLTAYGDVGTNDALYLGFVPATPATDQIWVWTGHVADTDYDSIGDTASLEEVDELYYAHATPTSGTQIGTKDEDHRTLYGVKIIDPKSHGSNDKEVFYIPGDQVKVNALIACEKAVTTGGGTTSTSVPITTSISKVDSEVTSADKSTKHLILVGGPVVNTLVGELATADKTKATDWYVEQGAGTALIDLVADAFADGKYALVVAGHSAADTRKAAGVLQDYGSYTLTGSRMIVTGTTASPVLTSA